MGPMTRSKQVLLNLSNSSQGAGLSLWLKPTSVCKPPRTNSKFKPNDGDGWWCSILPFYSSHFSFIPHMSILQHCFTRLWAGVWQLLFSSYSLYFFYLHRLSILGGLVVLYAGAIIPRIYFHKKRKYVPRFKILNYSRLQVYRGALITVTQTKISRNSQVLNPQESWI